MVSFLFALGMLFTPVHHAQSQPVRNAVQDYAPQIVTTIATEEAPADPISGRRAAFEPPTLTIPPAPAAPAGDVPPTVTVAPELQAPAADVLPTMTLAPTLGTPVAPVSAPVATAPVAQHSPARTFRGAAAQHAADSNVGQTSSGLTAEEAGLLDLINADRAGNGLAPVRLDSKLTELARAHSQDMADRNYFDHYAPAPGPASPMDRYLAALGYRPSFAMVGENIYYRSLTDMPDQTENQAETAFMNSPGHRANILQPRYTKVGVGFYRGDNGQFWVTEMFLRDEP